MPRPETYTDAETQRRERSSAMARLRRAAQIADCPTHKDAYHAARIPQADETAEFFVANSQDAIILINLLSRVGDGMNIPRHQIHLTESHVDKNVRQVSLSLSGTYTTGNRLQTELNKLADTLSSGRER